MRSSNNQSADWSQIESQHSQTIPQSNLPQSCILKMNNISKYNFSPSQVTLIPTFTNKDLQQQSHNLQPNGSSSEKELLKQPPREYRRRQKVNCKEKNNSISNEIITEARRCSQSPEKDQSKEMSSALVQDLHHQDKRTSFQADKDSKDFKFIARKNTNQRIKLTAIQPTQLNDYRNLLREAISSFVNPSRPAQKVSSKSANLNSLKELLSSRSCLFSKDKINSSNVLTTKNRKEQFKVKVSAFETTSTYGQTPFVEEAFQHEYPNPISHRKRNTLSPIQRSTFLKRDSCPGIILKQSVPRDVLNFGDRRDKSLMPANKMCFEEDRQQLKACQSQPVFENRNNFEKTMKNTSSQLKFHFIKKDPFMQSTSSFQERTRSTLRSNNDRKYEQCSQQSSSPLIFGRPKNNNQLSSPPITTPKTNSFLGFSSPKKDQTHLSAIQSSQLKKPYLRFEENSNPQESYFKDSDELQPWKQLNQSGIMEAFQLEEEMQELDILNFK